MVARAIGKAALATREVASAPGFALAVATGPVPRRVAALLTTPPAARLVKVLCSPVGLCAVAALLLTAVSGWSAVDAVADLRRVLEITEISR